MRVSLISPRLAVQKSDFLGSGVPYWPIELATFAQVLRDEGEAVGVIDLFGSAPARLADAGDHYLQGLPIDALMETEHIRDADAFVLFAISYMSFQEIIRIISKLRSRRPDTPIVVLENSQAVTAFSLENVAEQLFAAGARGALIGEPHFNWRQVKEWLCADAPIPSNVLTADHRTSATRIINKGARYPIPAWNLFPTAGYWSLPYAHGPKSRRYFPILTSRGCPYPCDFCVVPQTNSRRWRGNAPADVVAEILELRDKFGVYDFQIEDLNPTVDRSRFEEICRLLIAAEANVRFYLVSGTKAETVAIDQVPLYARAGCRFISISPETGSVRLLQTIGKPFNHQHALDLVAACRRVGIRTQACFIVGHPSETDADHASSRDYLARMIRAGLDEVAVFIVSSFAGSRLYAERRISIADSDMLPSFSPRGREGSDVLEQRRRELLRIFFVEKLKRGPDLWMQGLRSLLGRPQTKMENLPRRVTFILWRKLFSVVEGGNHG